MTSPSEREQPRRPVPPEKPLPTDCCDSGCDVCVFDAYADALKAYETALADYQRWIEEQSAARPDKQEGTSDPGG